jgi:hypothetical protein
VDKGILKSAIGQLQCAIVAAPAHWQRGGGPKFPIKILLSESEFLTRQVPGMDPSGGVHF